MVHDDTGHHTQILKGLLDMCLLAIVNEGPSYGYDMVRQLSEQGLEVAGETSRLRGTFINANHTAFYLTMAATVVFAWLWWSLRRLRRRGALEQKLLLTVVPGLMFLTFFAGVAFSGSRAGLAALVLAILFQGFLLALHYRRWQVGLLAAVAVAFGLAGLAVFGLRRARVASLTGREALAHMAWTGAGGRSWC